MNKVGWFLTGPMDKKKVPAAAGTFIIREIKL